MIGFRKAMSGEILRLGESFYGLLCCMVTVGNNHNGTHILHIRPDGEAEEQHQHQRHTEENQHRTFVAQDVTGFLDDEREEQFHIILSINSCGLSGKIGKDMVDIGLMILLRQRCWCSHRLDLPIYHD